MPILATEIEKKFWKKLPVGPLRLEKKFFRFFRPFVVQNGRFQKNLENFFFEPKRSLSDIFFEIFFVHDNKYKILGWPWKFEPLGQMRSKGHFDREQV